MMKFGARCPVPRWPAWLVVVAAGLSAPDRLRGSDDGAGDAADFFERRVRPVLVEHCLECHGAGESRSGLRLDSRDAVLRGGDRGAAVTPGDPARSVLVAAVARDGDLKMPPAGPLRPAERAALRQWVDMGAPWPDSQPVLAPAADDAARRARIQTARHEHWAFQPIRKPELPPGTDAGASVHPIDRFIRARLASEGLAAAPPADRRTLARRLSFDLVGLPPDAALLAAVDRDDSPEWYAALVERLLARPEYGEHWARHWLDVARYADTTGYQESAQREYPFAWTYRDYVIRSLDEDTPFDEFVVEQLAADQLELAPDEQWKLAAMGFLTLGPRFNYVRHEIIDDRIDVVTRGLMGLTVACARCHDHKYDPVLAEDYYALYGVFASSQEPLATDLPRIGPSGGDFSRYRDFRLEAARATRRFEQFHARTHRQIQSELRERVGDYLRYLVDTLPEHRTVTQPKFETERGPLRRPTPYGPGAFVRWEHYLSERGDDDPVFGLWNRCARLAREGFGAEAARLVAETEGINALVREALAGAAPQSMAEVAGVYGELLERIHAEWTDYDEANPDADRLPDPSAEQLRQVLYAADSPIAMNADEAHDCYTDGEFNRFMELKRELDSLFLKYRDVAAPRAMILADRPRPEEPRILVRGNASRPGPWVERRFVRVLADAVGAEPYSAGSGRLALARAIASPQNPLTPRVIVNRVWQWHFGRGLVDTASDFGARGTPPSHPELLDWLAADFVEHGWSLKRLHRQIVTSATYRQSSFASPAARERDPDNQWLSHMSRRRLGFESLRDSMIAAAGRLEAKRGGPAVEGLATPRRSIYLMVNRDDLPGVLATFDFPSPDISTARRAETTVPPQALFLMNSEFAASIVDDIVERMERELGPDGAADPIDWLYETLLSRRPDKREREIAAAVIEPPASARGATDGNDTRWHDLAHALLMSNEFVFVD